MRQKAILKAQEKAAVVSRGKAAKKQEENKFALQTMMKVQSVFVDDVMMCEFPDATSHHATMLYLYVKLEEEERAKIQTIKQKECEKAVTELETWKLKHKSEEEHKAVQGQQHSTQLERTPTTGKAEKSDVGLSSGRVATPHQG